MSAKDRVAPERFGAYNEISSFANRKGNQMSTTGAGLEGVIAGESEICYIDGYAGILSYRGYNIHTLADHASFEEVIFLLWNGRLPKREELDALKSDLAANRAIPQQVVDFLKSATKACQWTCCARPSPCSASTIRSPAII